MKVMKKILFAALILCVALSLCACKSAPEGENVPPADPTQKSALDVSGSVNSAADQAMPDESTQQAEPEGYAPQEVSSNTKTYAGATPVPLDPIDKPTATPRPELTFTYAEMQSDSLGFKFEMPGNWVRDDSQAGMIVFTDPTMLDNVNATITLKLANVSADYKVADIKTDIAGEMSLIGQYNFTEWSTTDCTERTILGKDGYYSDYRGVMVDGTIVRGRVQMALLDNGKLLTIEYNAPGWFNSSYKKVFDNLRSTLEAL